MINAMRFGNRAAFSFTKGRNSSDARPEQNLDWSPRQTQGSGVQEERPHAHIRLLKVPLILIDSAPKDGREPVQMIRDTKTDNPTLADFEALRDRVPPPESYLGGSPMAYGRLRGAGIRTIIQPSVYGHGPVSAEVPCVPGLLNAIAGSRDGEEPRIPVDHGVSGRVPPPCRRAVPGQRETDGEACRRDRGLSCRVRHP